MPMNFEALCLMDPHFVSRLFTSLSTPHTGMWLLKCWHAHSQQACDFWALLMMGSCKTWRKIRQSWVSFSWLKFFPFLGLDIATTQLGRTTMSTVNLASKKKILSSSSHACFQSLEGWLLGLSFSIAIMCCWGSVFVAIFVHLTTCHCHLTWSGNWRCSNQWDNWTCILLRLGGQVGVSIGNPKNHYIFT